MPNTKQGVFITVAAVLAAAAVIAISPARGADAPQDIVLARPAAPVELLRVKPDGTVKWGAAKDVVAKALLEEISGRQAAIGELNARLGAALKEAEEWKAKAAACAPAAPKAEAAAPAAEPKKAEEPAPKK